MRFSEYEGSDSGETKDVGILIGVIGTVVHGFEIVASFWV